MLFVSFSDRLFFSTSCLLSLSFTVFLYFPHFLHLLPLDLVMWISIVFDSWVNLCAEMVCRSIRFLFCISICFFWAPFCTPVISCLWGSFTFWWNWFRFRFLPCSLISGLQVLNHSLSLFKFFFLNTQDWDDMNKNEIQWPSVRFFFH